MNNYKIRLFIDDSIYTDKKIDFYILYVIIIIIKTL